MLQTTQTDQHAIPLDAGLNQAILTIATRLLPDGFDVADDAPATFEELKAHLDAGRRLVVYAGGSEKTIYVDPAVNHAFRAWHDLTHYRDRQDFSVAGETAVCEAQCHQLVAAFGDVVETKRWCAILTAEVIGQRLFYQRHKRFVVDQRGFVEAYLRDPEIALLWSLW